MFKNSQHQFNEIKDSLKSIISSSYEIGPQYIYIKTSNTLIYLFHIVYILFFLKLFFLYWKIT